MQKLILLIAVTILCTLNVQSAYACTCGIPTRSEIESKSKADIAQWLKSLNGAVFIGRVTKSDNGEITFEAERYWKGPGTKRIIIYTPISGAACGVSYEVSKKYLVFATYDEGKLHTFLCSHVTATQYKDIYLRKLGKGERPKR